MYVCFKSRLSLSLFSIFCVPFQVSPIDFINEAILELKRERCGSIGSGPEGGGGGGTGGGGTGGGGREDGSFQSPFSSFISSLNPIRKRFDEVSGGCGSPQPQFSVSLVSTGSSLGLTCGVVSKLFPYFCLLCCCFFCFRPARGPTTLCSHKVHKTNEKRPLHVCCVLLFHAGISETSMVLKR